MTFPWPRRRLLGALLVLAALPLAATSTAAAEPKERIGVRLSVLGPSSRTLPAGQPFHLAHGWGLQGGTPNAALGLWRFSLSVDGVEVDEDHVERFRTDHPTLGAVLNRFWIFNFPQGMTGTHTFTGRWFGPCQQAIDLGSFQGPCEHPNDVVTAFGPRSVTVAFVRPNLALGKAVTATGSFPGNPPSAAVDGDFFTYWSAGGFPPQSIEVDLGADHDVAEIALAITQLPDSETVHRVYGRADGGAELLLNEFRGFTVDQQVLRLATSPQRLRYVRVETTSSASWVGWREIEVYAP